jgi:hypothetical protein
MSELSAYDHNSLTKNCKVKPGKGRDFIRIGIKTPPISEV